MSKTKLKEETIVSKDGKTAIRYRLVSKRINLEALRKELAMWEKMGKPSKEELIEIGKAYHPYFAEREEQIAHLREKING